MVVVAAFATNAAPVPEATDYHDAALAQNVKTARLCQGPTLHCKLIGALLPWAPESSGLRRPIGVDT
jgi:hypothetical protein